MGGGNISPSLSIANGKSVPVSISVTPKISIKSIVLATSGQNAEVFCQFDS